MTIKPRVLVVDDEQALLAVLRVALDLIGYEMVGTCLLSEGLRRAVSEDFDCILLDCRLADGNADEIVPYIAGAKPHVPIVLVTGDGLDPRVTYALQAGACAVLPKPFGIAELASTLARHCQPAQPVLAPAPAPEPAAAWTPGLDDESLCPVEVPAGDMAWALSVVR